jgi:hypothetical protein
VSLPESIQTLIDTTLAAVQSHAQHEMDPLHRRAIYQAFASTDAPTTPRWSAVLTAQRLLPRFQQHYSDDTLPQELLALALKLVYGEEVDPATVETILDRGYHASAAAWGNDEREIPWPVWLAGNTAYHALNEAVGHPPLSILPDYYKGDVVTPWNDKDLCEHGLCDTAGAAAIASASDRYGQTIDPTKQLEFWTWWLTEAMPTAYRSALHGRHSEEEAQP